MDLLSSRLHPDSALAGRLPLRTLATTAIVSALLALVAQTRDYPLYIVALMAMAPWVPLFVLQLRWQYKNYELLAAFFALTVLQVGHLGEHAVQVTQLVMHDGELARSHGVFGQLDFETVHFFWDTAIWLGTLALFWHFGRGRARIWLGVSLLFASLHEVEHIYLYYVNLVEPGFYHESGGFAGIFGKGGIVPILSRPYLHFAYNFMVVIPMVIAYMIELTGAVKDRRLEETAPGPQAELATATAKPPTS